MTEIKETKEIVKEEASEVLKAEEPKKKNEFSERDNALCKETGLGLQGIISHNLSLLRDK